MGSCLDACDLLQKVLLTFLLQDSFDLPVHPLRPISKILFHLIWFLWFLNTVFEHCILLLELLVLDLKGLVHRSE
jgi:hypothetical protein